MMHAYAKGASPSDPRVMCGVVVADGLRDACYPHLAEEAALIDCPACLGRLEALFGLMLMAAALGARGTDGPE